MHRQQIYELVDGDGKAAEIYGRAMTVAIVVSLVPLCFKEQHAIFDALEYACVAIFVADYLMRLVTADFKLGRGKASFILYPFTPMAIIDLLSILPSFLVLNPAFRALRILRLFRLLRAFKLIRYSKGANAIAAAFEKQREPLLVVLGLAVAYVVVSALIVFNVEPDTFDTFFDAVYWAVVSLTTVGYGDLYPSTEVGRFIAMASSLMGIAVVALPSGIITAGLLEELQQSRESSVAENPEEPEPATHGEGGSSTTR